MCGIAGIIQFDGGPAPEHLLQALCHSLMHRGPDGYGSWRSVDRSVSLGHRRLAILDLDSRANQPMVSADGRHVLVFNGEIYNFLELRRELRALGEFFRTESDTEVVLAAWRVWGERMLEKFNGMWALAIYDSEDRSLFLSRDRFGIKPLLYSLNHRHLVFASEMMALISAGAVDPVMDQDVARRVLVDPFGIEGTNRTLFKGIHRLQAGHCMIVRNGRATVRRWWSTIDNLAEVPVEEDARTEKFAELFRESVAIRMRSDVPIGTSLSGGFDSTAVLCTMAECEREGAGARMATGWRHAFVASFPGLDNDERAFAETAADWAGVTPTILSFGSADALLNAEETLWSLDDVYIGLPTVVWRLYKEMREKGILVSLDGHGADELMGAYRQSGKSAAFWLRNTIASLAPPGSMQAIQTDRLRMMMLRRSREMFLRGKLRDVPPPMEYVGQHDVLPKSWGGMNRRLYHMFHGTVLPTILRNFDRLSMAHGVEVRMPFLDWRLVTYTMSLPDENKSRNGMTKVIARGAMRGRMPEEIRVQRRKVGFNSPMPAWLNGPLRPWVDDVLSRRVPEFDEVVDEKELRAKVAGMARSQAWTWQSAGRIWPYLHLKWLLAKLEQRRASAVASGENENAAAMTKM